MNDSDRHKIALHEAGHAIIAFHEGFEVEAVELHADGGSTYITGPGDMLEKGTHPRLVATSCALVAVAGAAASDVPMSARDNADLKRAAWLRDFDLRFFYADRDTYLELARERLDNTARRLSASPMHWLNAGDCRVTNLGSYWHEDFARRLSRGCIFPHAKPGPARSD